MSNTNTNSTVKALSHHEQQVIDTANKMLAFINQTDQLNGLKDHVSNVIVIVQSVRWNDLNSFKQYRRMLSDATHNVRFLFKFNNELVELTQLAEKLDDQVYALLAFHRAEFCDTTPPPAAKSTFIADIRKHIAQYDEFVAATNIALAYELQEKVLESAKNGDVAALSSNVLQFHVALAINMVQNDFKQYCNQFDKNIDLLTQVLQARGFSEIQLTKSVRIVCKCQIAI